MNEKSARFRRTILWGLVAAYTAALPDAIVVYRTIETHFSTPVAQKIPAAMIILLGISYILFGMITKKSNRHFVLLIPCTFIVYAVMALEPNPNKHIHIPEYILMTWLLYEALSIDYRGKGIYILIFLCSSMLGVVDELAQGIYPDRFYGWMDMGINSASSIIGVLTLMGLRTEPEGNWAWIDQVEKLKGPLGVMLFGAVGAVLMCVYMFDLKATTHFRSAYPSWLLGWSILFLTLAPVLFLFYWRRFRELGNFKDENGRALYTKAMTAHLWIVCPLSILLTMHAIAVFVVFLGMEFV
ncbi:VanZ family protein [Thermodesulfobacteriota bacterium]